MSKTWTVAKSEYLRRVRSKGFLLTTLLLPFAIALLLFVIVILTISALDDDAARTVAVVDETGALLSRLEAASDEGLQFVQARTSVEALRTSVLEGDLDGYLAIPADVIEGSGRVAYYTAESSLTLGERIERRVEEAVEAERIARADVAPELIERLRADVPQQTVRLTEEGEEAGNTGFFIGLGFGMGFLIFMLMIVYGGVVMQGVIDEKSSRVVEVIVSSVRPFQLMMGKVLGIGAMGLTQLLAWGVLILGVSFFAGALLALFVDPSQLPETLPENASTLQVLEAQGISIPTLSPWLFVWFVVYFLLGYLLFASIFAGVGALVESQQESQSYTLPIMIPVIIAMYTLMPQIESPHSALAVTMSLIPFTSPISMLVRMAVTDVPLWQVLLSVALLVATFVGTVWVVGRIYRVGILMYGKKPSLKDLAKWIRYA